MDEIKQLLSNLLEGQQAMNAKLDKLDQDVNTLKSDMKDVKERIVRVEAAVTDTGESINLLINDVYKIKKNVK